MNYVTISQEEFEMRREHSIQCARDKAVLRDKVLVLEEEAERLRFELSVVWNTALDAAKKTTARGLIGASDKEKTAHYTACKNIADAIDALKVGGSDTAVQGDMLLPANAGGNAT